ncbi:urea carboxylase-associated family protein [Zobellia alginiliquefaciens]|uniref:urea carboxylase-associated family protein n=1 Tax=Zobellia alginiliquefaciens TaxID=3032586 RepID=UPI0023E45A24|nr:urea carboxylase-associated family protein [Zobellia alginiliquefaciens]
MQIIPPKSGTSFQLKKEQVLKVTDIEGSQVSDILFFNNSDVKEKLSSGKTMDYEESILLTKGNYLYSNRSNKMVKIIEDTNGRNDFLLAPCDVKTFKHFYNMDGHHPSCFENLYTHLDKFGINKDEIPTAFNIFMNVQFNEKGKISVMPPTSKAGDYICFKAEMDLIVGITACSAKDSNGGSFKPIGYEIL